MARCVHHAIIFILVIGFAIKSFSQTFNGQGGLPVPPGAPGETVGITTSIATVSGIGILGEGCSIVENVTLDFTHTWVGDVAIFIIAPSGEVLELSSGNGSSGDNYQITVFTDNTPNFITSGSPPYNGTFRPEGRQTNTDPPFSNANPLGTFTFDNTFNGVNADGDWTLMINDYVALDVGILQAWSITFSVGGGPAPTVTLGPDVTICPGQTTTLTADVVPGADTYLWSTGATTSSINVSPTANTTYSVTVTNNSCTDADTINVIVNPNAVTADAGADVSICQGNSTTLTGSGGGSGATYNWSTGQSGATISVNPTTTTTYTLTVTDSGCSDTDQIVVTVTPLPNADAGQPVSICQGQSTTLTATGGSQNNHYLWSTGQTGSTISVSPGATTTYTVTVTVNGCSDSDDVTVTVNPLPTVSAGNDVQICSGESTTLSASGSGGTYLWSTGQSGSSIVVSPSTTTTYTVTATLNGCTATDNVTVTVGNITAVVTPDQAICEGSSLTLTVSGGTTYEWSTGETGTSINVSPSSTTTYTVTATQGACTDEASVTVTVNPIPTASVTPDQEICAGTTVTLTASGGTTYLWNTGQTSATINVTPPVTTTYTVTVTQSGCSSSASVVVDVNPSPNAFAGMDESICEGETVTLTASGLSGPGTYEWSTGETGSTINVSPAQTTTYTVTVTNEWNCTDIDAVMVTVNSIPDANAGADQEICDGASATLTATGGSNPASYQWSTGQTGATIVVNPASTTTYTVTITIAGCSAEDEVEVAVLPSPVADAGTDEQICAGESVELTASGGGTYMWNSGQSSQTINVSPGTTTTYTVTVTHASGCTDVDDVIVTVFQLPLADAGPDQSICDGEAVSLSGSGGGSYQWSTGENTQVINVAPAATTSYSLTVTDNNGCSDTDIATVVVNPIPFANAGSNVFILAGESTTLTASGGGSYLWSTGETTETITVTPSVTTTYSVTVTVNGCSDEDDVTVFVNEAPSVDLGPDQVICEGETVTIDATISGPFELDYIWSNGETTSIINVTPSVSTSYSVTATDLISGLSTIDSVLITVISLPIGTPVINGLDTVCSDAVSTYTIDPVSGADNYMWSVPSGASIVTGQNTTSIDINWSSSTGGLVQLIASNTCGSIPAAILEVVVQNPPIIIGPISGQIDPCADASTSYSIAPVSNADTYLWSVPGPAVISSGQGTNAVSIAWNGAPGGQLCIIATNECGQSVPVCMEVMTTTNPVLNAGNDDSICGTEYELNATGTGQWSQLSGPGIAIFADINSPSTMVQVDTPGIYLLNYSLDQNGCTASDEIAITFTGTPEIINEITDCNDTNTAFTISFGVSGGTAPYLINGNAWTGGVFTSAPLPSGSTYSYFITDANGCVSDELTGEILCLCTSESGLMDGTPVSACADETITATYLGGEVLDGNDVLAFILHDGNIPGGIIAWNQDPSFQFLPTMLTDVTYFISAVTGDAVAGLPSLSDPCLAVSPGTPVRFLELPSLSLSNDTAICEGTCIDLLIGTSGEGDMEITYMLGAQSYSMNAVPGQNKLSICPDTASVYSFTMITDQNCSAAINEDIQIDVLDNVFAGIPSSASFCEGEIITIDLHSFLSGEDSGGSWSEMSAVPSTGNAFNASTATFQIMQQLPGTYSFSYSVPGVGECPPSEAIVEIEIAEVPVANAGNDLQMGCNENETTIDGSASSTGIEILYSWSTVDGAISGATDIPSIKALRPGTYLLEVKNRNSGCLDRDTVIVTGHDFSLDQIQLDVTPPLCAGDCNGIILVEHSIPGLMIDFGNGLFSTDVTFDKACPGNMVVSLMDSLGCIQDTMIAISDPEPVHVNLGNDIIVLQGQPVTLQAEVSSNVIRFHWLNADTCTSCSSIVVHPIQTTSYTVEVEDHNQCSAFDEILVTVLADNKVFIPDIFSPNGDQVNDLFIIESNSADHIASFEIYDRWGNQVFVRHNVTPGDPSQGWDGTYRGSPLSPGVYVYRIKMITPDGDPEIMTGDLTLIR